MKKIGYIVLVILTAFLLTSCEEEGRDLEQVETADASCEEESRDLERVETADAGKFEIPAGYTAIDYNELEGEEYYFYLFADCFLKELSDFLIGKNDDIDVFEEYIGQEKAAESVFDFISGLKESGAEISGYYLLRQENSPAWFNDFMEVPALIEFVYENQIAERESDLLFIQKTMEEEDVFWKLTNIELWNEEEPGNETEAAEIETKKGEQDIEKEIEAEKESEEEQKKELDETKPEETENETEETEIETETTEVKEEDEEKAEEEAGEEAEAGEQPESPQVIDNSRWEKDAIPYTETKIISHFTHNLMNCANYLGKTVLVKPRPGIL